MIKNILMYVIVIAVVGVGIWLFMRKGNTGNDMYSASGSPSASPSVSATPAASGSPTIVHSETKPDGLKIEDEVIGTGAVAAAGQTVTVNYTGWLTNGTAFDSSVDPAFGHVQPFSFPLGAGQVIKGWDEGVAGMKVGGKRRLTIPSTLAYGSDSNGAIPANSTLVFEVQLLSVK